MTKNQLLALAAFITTLANEGECTETSTTAAAGEATGKRRGRPPTTEKSPDTEKTQEPETVSGKTYEELQAIIRPLVESGQGADVKKVIAKYGESLKDISTKPQHHTAFEKDIAALSY